LECVLAGVISLRREFEACGSLKSELLALGSGDRIGKRVEGEGSGERESSDDIGGCYEGVGGGVGVITASEIAVVGGND